MVSLELLRDQMAGEARRNPELRRLLTNLLWIIGPDAGPPAWWRDLDPGERVRCARWLDLAAHLVNWPPNGRWWNG